MAPVTSASGVRCQPGQLVHFPGYSTGMGTAFGTAATTAAIVAKIVRDFMVGMCGRLSKRGVVGMG
jgi:hypothetical protein